MKCLGSSLALPVLLSMALPAGAADLTVSIAPAEATAPASVSLEPDNAGPIELTPVVPAQKRYTGTLAPDRSEWVVQGLVVARWANKSQPIKLRVTQMSMPQLPVWVFNYDYSPDMSTLNRIDDGRSDLESSLTRYFVARDVYARIGFMHEVKVRALKIWYDAAYSLAKQKRYFAIDEEVMTRGAAIEVEARTSPQLASLLQKYNRAQDYFTENNRQFRWLYYSEISQVARLVASRDFRAAQIINDYYLDQVGQLSDEERQEMFRVKQIEPDTLAKNAEFLKKLVPGANAELAPK